MNHEQPKILGVDPGLGGALGPQRKRTGPPTMLLSIKSPISVKLSVPPMIFVEN